MDPHSVDYEKDAEKLPQLAKVLCLDLEDLKNKYNRKTQQLMAQMVRSADVRWVKQRVLLSLNLIKRLMS